VEYLLQLHPLRRVSDGSTSALTEFTFPDVSVALDRRFKKNIGRIIVVCQKTASAKGCVS
jgi:hypothetical protein